MFKSWSFKNEYKNINKKVLFKIDKPTHGFTPSDIKFSNGV